MTEKFEELYKFLEDEDFADDNIDFEPVNLEVEEEMMIQILKDIVDTSWGRDTLDRGAIERWLDNFTGTAFDVNYERKLALILAIHVVYYNENDICYLVKIAYRKLLHEIMTKQGESIDSAAESIVFYPLGSISESGPFLSYYFRKENNLSIDFFINTMDSVLNIPQVKNIVFLDDVSISGGQVSWYMKKMKKQEILWEKLSKNKNFYALFLVSTLKAQQKLEQEGIQLCTPILMDERSQCFKEESAIYKIFEASIRNTIRMQSKYMAQLYGYKLLLEQYRYNGEIQRLLDEKRTPEYIKNKIKKDALGYDDSQVLIAFEYNTPNNCLPIIWAENDIWRPLFKRYDKLYSAQVIGGIKNETVYI